MNSLTQKSHFHLKGHADTKFKMHSRAYSLTWEKKWKRFVLQKARTFGRWTKTSKILARDANRTGKIGKDMRVLQTHGKGKNIHIQELNL